MGWKGEERDREEETAFDVMSHSYTCAPSHVCARLHVCMNYVCGHGAYDYRVTCVAHMVTRPPLSLLDCACKTVACVHACRECLLLSVSQ